MPLYEYLCDDCGRRFELIRKFSDPPLEKCPHCGGTVRKLFSSPAIQFKGSGFYITDYAKKDQTPGSASGETKSETGSKDKDTSDKSGEKAERAEKAGSDKAGKSEKAEKASKDDKSSTKTEATPAKAPTPSKESS